MPDQSPVIGGTYTVYVPDVAEQIALGYTGIRIYWGTSESGSFSVVTTLSLVAGTYDYTYNKTDATPLDWAYHAYYGLVPGEAAASDPVPVGGPQCSRLQVRQGVGRRLRMLETCLVTTGVSALSVIATDFQDPDAMASRFANWFLRMYSGVYKGQTRRVRTVANAGYVPATGAFVVNRAFTGSPGVGDGIELWRPKGDEDPSILIDEAMNRARARMWVEDSVLLTAETNVTEYFLPATVTNPGQVKSVAYAGADWPDRPSWTAIPYARASSVDGQGVISLTSGPASSFAEGTVIRVLVNRVCDRMDADTDYWPVPLEWAIEEVALDFLLNSGPTGGREDTSDTDRMVKYVEQSVMALRTLYLPSVQPRVVLPR